MGWRGAGVVLRTTNGGAEWNNVGGGLGGAETVVIEALSADTAFIGSPGQPTRMFRTTNGGSAWGSVFSQAGGYIDGIRMINTTLGMAIGDPVGGRWTILRTSDGGATWNRISTEPNAAGGGYGYQNSFCVLDSTHIWFGTNQSRVYRSTDAGLTWTQAGTPFVNTFGVWFNDLRFGVSMDSAGGVAARSTDGGATWSYFSLQGSGPSFGVSGAGLDFWISRGTSIYRSTNHGVNWFSSFAGNIGTIGHLNFVQTGGTFSGWAASLSGGIASFTGSPTDVGEVRASAPVAFALKQNYLNPFNPSTRIGFSVPYGGTGSHPQEADGADFRVVTLKVFDVLGREVGTLVNESLQGGSYEATFDGTELSSGVYFYRLQVSDMVQTREMLLLR